VRYRLSGLIGFIMVCAICSSAKGIGQSAPSGEQFVGVWSGTWEGAGGSGGFELTLEKGKDSAVTGRVSVTGEPTYKANFKSLSFDGKKMTAKYDFPPAEADAEVVLETSFDGNTAKGTWSLRAKTNDAEAAAGTWSVTKK